MHSSLRSNLSEDYGQQEDTDLIAKMVPLNHAIWQNSLKKPLLGQRG